MTAVLDRRALNRALLARQGLLARERTPALAMVERLAGMQAQTAPAPHIGLWTRIAGYDPAELDGLLTGREAVRMLLMRATVHLVSTRDALAWRPLVAPVLDRALRAAFRREFDGLDRGAVEAVARAVLAEGPIGSTELGRRLTAPGGPAEGYDPAAAGNVARGWVPQVQPPPRGLWNTPGAARHVALEDWTGHGPDPEPAPEQLVRRYLAAFGPATVMDAQAWCGLTRLGPVFERLRPELVTFTAAEAPDGDELAGRGRPRELFDLPDAPRPPADTPAPVRLLPVFDNVVLGHADRSRVVADAHRTTVLGSASIDFGPVLVDGFAKATWRVTRDGRRSATLTVTAHEDLRGVDVRPEAEALLAFVARGEAVRRVEVRAP